MDIAIPSHFNLVKGWHARPGKETVTIGLRLTDRSITLRNGACPYPTRARADRHLDILDVPTSQTRPQEPVTVAARPHEPVDHDQSTPPSSLGNRSRLAESARGVVGALDRGGYPAFGGTPPRCAW